MGGNSYFINGRFLTQTMSGVQRYAANVVHELATLSSPTQANILVPADFDERNQSVAGGFRRGRLTGHLWEQLELPILCRGTRLLNLCNTAPALKRDQIVCIHDAQIFAIPESYSASFRAFYRALQPMLAARSARVATVSHAAARQLARYLPIALDDVAVLTNGHEHALAWDPSLSVVGPSLIETSGRPFVVGLGSHASHKNLALLFGISAALDELGVDIILVGGGDRIYAAQHYPSFANIRWAGRVSDDDLAFLLDHAICLAFPSLAEGFGLPIVEAMARGCPVVSSNCASMPEVCGQAALLASPFDLSQWVAHVAAIMRSRDLREDLVGRGRERAKLFSWRGTAEGFAELLEKPTVRLAPSPSFQPKPPTVAAIFATRHRPSIVERTVRHFLASQTLQPSTVIVSCVEKADAGSLSSLDGVTILTGPGGLTAQRNTALSSLESSTEIVAFFDDDFVADGNWLAEAAQVFADESMVVGFTGAVLADGIKGPGISFEEALRIVGDVVPDPQWERYFSPYGCNMAFRFSAIANLRFDERLVLYGWLEDRDFAAALAHGGGRLVKCSRAYGVHMGAKSGRVAGQRLGYSQIVNPLYMSGKGTMSRRGAVNQIFRNVASNVSRVLYAEPFIDRRGRLKGNFLGLRDAFRGRLEPERAAAIKLPGAIDKRSDGLEAR